jgi:zona occludens toxin
MSGAMQSGANSSKKSDEFDPVADAKKYVYMETPRVQGLLYTSPKYDELTKPSAVPMPAACIDSANRCQCYTQQGTKIAVSKNLCIDIAYNGYFQEFNPNGRNIRQESLNSLPDKDRGTVPPVPSQEFDKQPAKISLDGYGVLGVRGKGVRTPALQSEVSKPTEPDQQEYKPRVPVNSPWRAS